MIGNFLNGKLNGSVYINLISEEIYCEFVKGIVSNKVVYKYFKEYDVTF